MAEEVKVSPVAGENAAKIKVLEELVAKIQKKNVELENALKAHIDLYNKHCINLHK